MKKIPKKLAIIDVMLCLIALFILLEVIFHGYLTSIDLKVNASMPTVHNTFFFSIAKIIDTFFDTTPILILALILAIVVWFRYSKKEALFFASTMIVDAAVIVLLKILIHRSRPANALIIANDYAFPSGHAVTSIVFFGLIAYMLLRNVKLVKLDAFKSAIIKGIIIGVTAAIIIVIDFSRIYLNIHWLSDVLGGLAIGAVILTTSIILQQTIDSKFLE